MGLVFIILLDLYLLVKIIKTILDILDFFEIRKSAKKMAKIWEDSIEKGCQCYQEDKPGKHAL